ITVGVDGTQRVAAAVEIQQNAVVRLVRPEPLAAYGAERDGLGAERACEAVGVETLGTRLMTKRAAGERERAGRELERDEQRFLVCGPRCARGPENALFPLHRSPQRAPDAANECLRHGSGSYTHTIVDAAARGRGRAPRRTTLPHEPATSRGSGA